MKKLLSDLFEFVLLNFVLMFFVQFLPDACIVYSLKVQHAALHHFDVVILGDWVQTKEDGFSMMR
jgi:hypothetical protein